MNVGPDSAVPRAQSRPAPATLQDAESKMDVGYERIDAADNYYGWQAELAQPHLGATCLEIGSGHGHLTELLARGRTLVASDISPQYVVRLEQRFAGAGNVSVRLIDMDTFVPDDRYDTIVMMNVLEHIEDDAATLATLRNALNPGGRLVVYVPAFMLLYSKFDRDVGHYRRYSKKQLRRLMEASGYKTVEARYVNSLGALGWFVYCRLLGRSSSDQLTISACDRIVIPVVRRIERRIAPPFGLSALVVGQVA